MDDIAKTIAETLRDPEKVAVISKNLVDLGALFERAAEIFQALAREVEKMGEAATETTAELSVPPPNHYPSSKRRRGAPVDLATRYKNGEDVVGDIASVLAVRMGLPNEIRRISGGDAIRIGKREATVCFWRRNGKFIAYVEPDTNTFDKIDMAMRAMGFEHN